MVLMNNTKKGKEFGLEVGIKIRLLDNLTKKSLRIHFSPVQEPQRQHLPSGLPQRPC